MIEIAACRYTFVDSLAGVVVRHVEHVDELVFFRYCLIRMHSRQGRTAESVGVYVFTRVHLFIFRSYSLMFVDSLEVTCLF